jgi:RNA polymerase subunit RPABC4/transcription elongation factor Spt4
MTEPVESVADSSAQSERRYFGWAFALLTVSLVVGIVALASDSSTGPDGQSQSGVFGTVGVLLYLGVYASLVALDWNRFLRAIAAHRWFSGAQGQRNGCLVVFLYVVIVPYVLMFYPFYGLFRYGRGYLNQRRRYPLERQRRVAELEARLGIEPEVEGQCPNCGKALQVDAEFCSFCGTRVKPVVRVCPKCGTVALPNAEWCAKCGTALGTGSATGEGQTRTL